MVNKAREQINSRADLKVIAEIIPPNVRILDLGCGDGSLLYLLRKEKNVYGCGVEISEDKILDCVSSGVPVVHADLNEGLREFPDSSFDYVVLSQTLQAVRRPDILLDEMMRVGKKSIISFINFGHFSIRFQLMFRGAMPSTDTLPNPWYETSNIHLATISDFKALCNEKKIKIVSEIPLADSFNLAAKFYPNLFAPTCVFIIEK